MKKWLLTCAIILLNIMLFYKLIMLEYLLRVVMYVKHFIKHCLKLSEKVNLCSGVVFYFIKLLAGYPSFGQDRSYPYQNSRGCCSNEH